MKTNGCPVCNSKLNASGEHDNYEVACIRGCYKEKNVEGKYDIELFDRKYVLNDFSEFDIIDNVIEELSKTKGYKR